MKKEIILFGPSENIRSGISEHTKLLFSNLKKKKVKIKFVKFQKIYPELIYPGNSQFIRNKKKNITNQTDIYLTDILGSIRKIKKIYSRAKNSTIVLIHWTFYLIPYLLFINFIFKNNKKILLCHNVIDHDAGFLKKIYTNFFLSKYENFVVQSKDEKKLLEKFVTKKKISILKHPVYDQYKNLKLTHKFNIPKKKTVILSFGILRKYKGLDDLLKALKNLKRKDIFLVIAGEIWFKNKMYWNQKIDESNMKNNTLFIDRYISSEEVKELFTKSDCLVLTHKKVTGSGVEAISRSFNIQVLAPNFNEFKNQNYILFDKKNRIKSIRNKIESLKKKRDIKIKKRNFYSFKNYAHNFLNII